MQSYKGRLEHLGNVTALFPEMDECHVNIIKAILANPEMIDGLYFEHFY